MDKYYAKLGLNLENPARTVHCNLLSHQLIEKAVQKGHGQLSAQGSLVIRTGKNTGRSANDKYVVKDSQSENKIWWENSIHAMTPENFQKLKQKVLQYLNEDRELFIGESCVGAHAEHNVGIRLVTTHPSHALFASYLFRPIQRPLKDNDFTILHAPELNIDPQQFGTKSPTVVATCFTTNTTIIVGTLYAGEIKKSMFCVLNYMLPDRQVLPMHAGSNELQNKDVSLFFGLSGTGKTTLSTDEGTFLIGDDEHGLSEDGVFNFEGGCYAKTFKLSQENEPEIYKASTRFGSMLENVTLNPSTGLPDFDSDAITENGRSSYPLSFIDSIEPSAKGKVANNIFFLSCDAFGILPPVASLTKEQAMFYFVLGYTAKVAGTEIGIKSPQAAFSPCFGAPFMLRHPSVYAKLLGHYLAKYPINVWLVNTGWTGGPYGTGTRFPIKVTREIIRTIQAGKLQKAEMEQDPIFGFKVPSAVGNISKNILRPEQTWDDKAKYQAKARELATTFHQQMQRFGDFYEQNKQGAPTFRG